MIHSCARDVFALLIAVDTPARSTRRCRPDALSLYLFVIIAVDIQLYRAGDIQLRQRCFRFANRG